MLTKYKKLSENRFFQLEHLLKEMLRSNDGITFTEIIEASQMTRLISSDYTSWYSQESSNSSFTTQYQYIGFTFEKLLSTSGQTDLSFTEFQLFGKAIKTNLIIFCELSC